MLARLFFTALALVVAAPLALAGPSPPKVAIVAPAPSVLSMIGERHTRVWARLTPPSRAKLLAATHKLASEIDAQNASRTQVDIEASARRIQASIPTAGIDLASVPAEDIAVIVIYLVGQDARSDLRELITELEQTRHKRATLRDAIEKLKRETAEMKADAERLRAYEELLAQRIDFVNQRLARIDAALAGMTCYRNGNGETRCVPAQKPCNCPAGDICYRNGNEPNVTHCVPGPKPCNCAPGEICYRDGNDPNVSPKCAKGPAPCNCAPGESCYRNGSDSSAPPHCVPGPAACNCPPGDVCYREGAGGAPRCISPK